MKPFVNANSRLVVRNLRRITLIAGLLAVATACRAGTVQFTYYVPPAEEGKSPPGGWGALVLHFDGPITGATFTFDPACPVPQNGLFDPGSANETIQLGPGGYGLGQTGTLVEKGDYAGQPYGYFNVTVDFPGDDPPNLTDAFWQYKTKSGGNPTWTFNPNQDAGAPLPEPSTLVLTAFATVGLLTAVWRGWCKRRPV